MHTRRGSLYARTMANRLGAATGRRIRMMASQSRIDSYGLGNPVPRATTVLSIRGESVGYLGVHFAGEIDVPS